jgi:hypothetical protein
VTKNRFAKRIPRCYYSSVLLAAIAPECHSDSSELIAEQAAFVYEIARIKPYKRKRLKVLAQTRKDLLDKLSDTELILAQHW